MTDHIDQARQDALKEAMEAVFRFENTWHCQSNDWRLRAYHLRIAIGQLWQDYNDNHQALLKSPQ